MSRKNKLMIGLMAIGLVMYAIVNFIIIPHNNAKQEKYLSEQLNPITHDINYILKYKNKYMGNASNIANLYHHLPLADINKDFELLPDELMLIVNYKDTVSNIGDEKVKSCLIYNATASFALIDNLDNITYHFTGTTYSVSRTDIENLYDHFEHITDEAAWQSKVRGKLNEDDVSGIFRSVFVERT